LVAFIAILKLLFAFLALTEARFEEGGGGAEAAYAFLEGVRGRAGGAGAGACACGAVGVGLGAGEAG